MIDGIIGDVMVRVEKHLDSEGKNEGIMEHKEEALHEHKEAIESLAQRINAACDNLLRQNHIVEYHSAGDLGALLVIIFGVMCFFVSLLTFIIDTQPLMVWIPTIVAVAFVTSILMRNEWRNHPRVVKLWIRRFGRKALEWSGLMTLYRAFQKFKLRRRPRHPGPQEPTILPFHSSPRTPMEYVAEHGPIAGPATPMSMSQV
ncbi:hypothetical protein VKT23_010931 [Stygiomarasmius scandens]|uniref:Uncharacterized protein n=1 Tax=Marasmiellus scandens TaxID=2682957 RepID=A0ABR1JG94_9AGAR